MKMQEESAIQNGRAHFTHTKRRAGAIKAAGSLLLSIGLLLLVLWPLRAQSAAMNQEAHSSGQTVFAQTAISTTLQNASFECANGYTKVTTETYAPVGWTLVISGSPTITSARSWFAGGCSGDAHVERIEGTDSLYLRAQDLETPPEPGKPFDVAIYQQVRVQTNTAYSLSGWMLSLCGGSAVPSDCPADYYMAKMLGIDPTGGTNPLADTVVWQENRDNFVSANSSERIGWANVRTAAHSAAPTMTLFARVSSPFRWHGNHAFVDALSLKQAPVARLVDFPDPTIITGTAPYSGIVTGAPVLDLSWRAEQSTDVTAIPGGEYSLLVDIQYRQQGSGDMGWTDFTTITLADARAGAGCVAFRAPAPDIVYSFRTRARAEQIGETGVFPTQRYPGVWSEPVSVLFSFVTTPILRPSAETDIFLPYVTLRGSEGVLPERCQS